MNAPLLKATGQFFLIGSALLALRAAWGALAPPERPALEVAVPAEADEAEVRARIDEEILVAESIRHGWLRTDPVIRRQLVLNLRFVGVEGSDEELMEQALSLGMHRADPVIRRRLVERVYLRADLGAGEPTEAELRDHLEAHPERFARPAQYRLSAVFLSRQRWGEALADEARALVERLRSERPDPLEAHRLGDPFIHNAPELTASGAELDRRFGPGFGATVAGVEPGSWGGPLESAYGLHLVWVHEVISGELPPLDQVRDRVAASLRHDRRHRRRADYLRRLRRWYRVRVVREEGP